MARNKIFLFILLSYATILIIFMNLITIHSPLVGAIASFTYFLINATVLGRFFFEKEHVFFRLIFGNLLLIMLLGLVSWAVMVIYNLDILRSVIALCIVTTLSSFLMLKIENAQWDIRLRTRVQWRTPTRLDTVRLLYLCMIGLLFYLLFMSRSGEVHTVWEFMHPAFVPVLFATTFLLLAVIFSTEKIEYKLLFIILYSTLIHTFFVIIFPAGDVGGQQFTLSRTRLVFDNAVFHGLRWPEVNIFLQFFSVLRGENFQAAISVILARMVGVDVYWSHSLLIPLLWGAFVPIAAFKVTKKLTGSKNVSILSSLLVFSFPSTIYWGAISVPNSLGYIFFFCSLFFILKYLSSDEPKVSFLMVTFCLIALLSHFLAGIISFSLLFLAIAIREYEEEKGRSPVTTRILLLSSFIFCMSLLPLSLPYLRIFYPLNSFQTHFGFDKLYGLSAEKIIELFMIGEYVNFRVRSVLFYGLGPLLGLLGIIYYLRSGIKQRSNKNRHVYALFLFMGFLIVLVDYRILKLFIVGIPFAEERLWMFRDFIAAPFVAIIANGVIAFLRKKTSNALGKVRLPSLSTPLMHAKGSFKSVVTFTSLSTCVVAYVMIFTLLSGWVTTSVYYGYPRWGPLQTTSYELEAVKYIDKNTAERYIVICDQWITYGGGIIVGFGNPRAFYFSSLDPRGVALFIEMKENPTNETMIKAMETNNATTAYFIISKLRLGEDGYNRVIQQAQQNRLQTYPGGIFYYRGEEKLRIFYYKKSTDYTSAQKG